MKVLKILVALLSVMTIVLLIKSHRLKKEADMLEQELVQEKKLGSDLNYLVNETESFVKLI